MLKLDDWQREALEHRGDLILCTGRQIGKTTIMAIKAAQRMIEKPNIRIIIVSLTEDQAKLIINMIVSYLEKNYNRQLKKGNRFTNQSRVTTRNNSYALARPVGNSGDAIRGFTGDILIIDEGSRFPELAFISGEPTLISTGGEVWICSTPFGKKGYFWEQFNAVTKQDDTDLENEMGWKVIHQSGEEAIYNRPISISWTKEKREKSIKRLESIKKRWSALRYGQEIQAKFLDDLQQFFPDALILRQMTQKRRETILKNRHYYIGVDIARMGEDESTFEILDKINNDTLIQVENQITEKTILTQTASHIISLNSQYDFKKIYVDDEGIGIGVFDQLISNPLTRRKTKALRNSKKIIDYKASRGSDSKGRTRMLKEDLYLNLLALMENNKIHFLDDPTIFQSFKSVQYEFTNDKRGKPFMKIFGNNTHIVEGLIRAAWCIKEKNIKVSISWI